MKVIFKNLISFLLPIAVLIIIPLLIEKNIEIKYFSTFIPGVVLVILGLSVIIYTISIFIKIGKGTLAPWSPTKRLIINGIYKYVRNPMITGVLIVLIGESLAILSERIFLWAIIFFIINTIYFYIYEEPNLEKRYGEEYRKYKKYCIEENNGCNRCRNWIW